MKIEGNIQGSHRAAIAAAARRRFRRFGYAKTSMQEIASDCGMSVANLYRFHDGKLALGLAVAAAERVALFAGCDRAVAAAPAGVAVRLTVLFQSLIDGTRRQLRTSPLLFELGMTVARDQPDHRLQFLREAEIRIQAILASAGAAEPWAGVNPKATSRLVLMARAPFVLPWMLRTQPFGNPRAQVAPLMRCLVAGLAQERSP